jgi:hypothetical protein
MNITLIKSFYIGIPLLNDMMGPLCKYMVYKILNPFIALYRLDQISNWVQALTVPLNLGLKNRPSVPHTLIPC